MKILILGDTHGHDSWKRIIEKEKPDKTIFLGDYLDSYDISKGSSERMVQNMKEIFELPNAIRLIGNHELHYLIQTAYSGKRNELTKIVPELLHQWIKEGKLLLSYVHKNYLFSHAGYTNYWWENQVTLKGLDTTNPMSLTLKDINLRELDIKGIYDDPIRGIRISYYGDLLNEGPLWIRPASLFSDPLKGFIQIVGHTQSKEPIIFPDIDSLQICLLDCRGSGWYGIIGEDNLLEIKQEQQ